MKQVIVVNEALNLPRGKLAAQVAHASVASLASSDSVQQKEWFEVGMPKIVLAGENEDEITKIYDLAVAAKLPAYVIKDAGRTVVASGTITCVGIGPAKKEDIDKVTGQLKLVK